MVHLIDNFTLSTPHHPTLPVYPERQAGKISQSRQEVGEFPTTGTILHFSPFPTLAMVSMKYEAATSG